MNLEVAMQIAKDICNRLLMSGDWPKDTDGDWVDVCKDWDLNVFTDHNGRRRAMLYPVTNGYTQTVKEYPVNF